MLPTLPNEIINIIMSYVIKHKIYSPLLTISNNIDYVNRYYNHSIPFYRYFLLKRHLLLRCKEKYIMVQGMDDSFQSPTGSA